MIKTMMKVLTVKGYVWVKNIATSNAILSAPTSEVHRASPKTGIIKLK